MKMKNVLALLMIAFLMSCAPKAEKAAEAAPAPAPAVVAPADIKDAAAWPLPTMR